MRAMATHLLNVADSHAGALRVLSLADGSIQERWRVPTSVMLAHAFSSVVPSDSKKRRVFIVGADVKNPISAWEEEQWQPPQLPSWLELRAVALDNQSDFQLQLFGKGQCDVKLRFDAVVMRQGLCFCDDPS